MPVEQFSTYLRYVPDITISVSRDGLKEEENTHPNMGIFTKPFPTGPQHTALSWHFTAPDRKEPFQRRTSESAHGNNTYSV